MNTEIFENMLPEERQKHILTLIKDRKSINVKTIASELFINEATIRRDLNILEKTGLIKRIYGGAVLIEGLDSEIPLFVRESSNMEGKKKIGEIASNFINDGDTIFLDSSSTTSCIIPHILQKKALKIITNGAKTAILLSKLRDSDIFCTGGKLRENSLSFIGNTAQLALSNFYVDACFFSCRGVSIEKGLTDGNEDEAILRKILLKNSRKVFLLADNSKIDNISFFYIEELNKINTLITDKQLSEEWKTKLNSLNIKYNY